MRNELSERIRPFTDQLADDLADLVATRIESVVASTLASIDEAFGVALSALASEPTATNDAPELRDRRRKTEGWNPSADSVKRPRKSSSSVGRESGAETVGGDRTSLKAQTPAPLPAKPQTRAPRSCRKCGAIGYRSDGCGRTHNTDGTPTPPANDDSEDEQRAPRTRPSRGVAIAEEIPVIPHTTLVAMLFADRANNAVGDTGGTPLRADAGPSLIGHTDEKRELCPVHGWVGRVAFERDLHELCGLDGLQCASCEGRKVVAGGFCRRCGGSGVEPVEVEAPAIEKPEQPQVAGLRASYASTGLRDRRRVAPRAKTLAIKRITKASLAAGAQEVDELDDGVIDEPRPRVRAQCEDAPRPCGYVACRHHLYLDVNPETGSIKINFPDAEPWELQESCSLDIAERGGLTLEGLGNVLNVTRERARQLETKAAFELRAKCQEQGIEPNPEGDVAEDAA